jgi:hypothetical protein
MRAELAAIYVALDKYKHDLWLGIFTDSQTSLHAIQNELQRPSHTNYHHHKPLISAIVDILLYRAKLGLPTALHKIRGHTNIRGNDRADVAAKRVVAAWDDIPEYQKLTVTIGRQAERPPYWVMYTKNSYAPQVQLSTGPRSATLRQPWWTIPENERLCMYAFTHPSKQLRQKVRTATLKSLYHTSLYRRLILTAKARGAHTAYVGTALHSRIRSSPREGITILKFLYGQLYNGKLAYRYGLAPTDACPLCGLPDSCTHIAGECSQQTNNIISRHNAACQLTHAAIRTAFKGGGTIYSPHDLQLVSTDAGSKHQTQEEDLEAFTFSTSQDHEYHTQQQQQQTPFTTDWLSHTPPTAPPPRRNRRLDVSIDTKTLPTHGVAAMHDEEGVAAPRYIPAWALPQEDLDSLIAAGAGAAPDIVYARGMPSNLTSDFNAFNRKDCSLLLFEVGFCRDLGCHEKYKQKTDKYFPLLTALRKYWGRVELICIPIGHAGTTLVDTANDFADALAKVRPSIAAQRKGKGHKTPEISSTALLHDKRIAKTLLNKLCLLAQTRLLGIIAHRQKKIREQETTRDVSTTLARPIARQPAIRHLPIITPRPLRTAII